MFWPCNVDDSENQGVCMGSGQCSGHYQRVSDAICWFKIKLKQGSLMLISNIPVALISFLTCRYNLYCFQVVGNCGMYGSMGSHYDCCKTIIPCGGVVRNETMIAYYQNPSYPDTQNDPLSCNINVSILIRNNHYINCQNSTS